MAQFFNVNPDEGRVRSAVPVPIDDGGSGSGGSTGGNSGSTSGSGSGGYTGGNTAASAKTDDNEGYSYENRDSAEDTGEYVTLLEDQDVSKGKITESKIVNNAPPISYSQANIPSDYVPTGSNVTPVAKSDAEVAKSVSRSTGDNRRTSNSSKIIVDYLSNDQQYRKSYMAETGSTPEKDNPSLYDKEVFGKDLQSHGVYDRAGSNWDSTFSRVGIIDPYNTTTTTTEYVFFMKPDLHLYDGANINPDIVKYSPYLTDAIERYPHIASQLQFSQSFTNAGGPLSPLLSNAFAGGLEMPGISADTIETPKNVYDENIKYRGTSYKSDSDFDFSTEMKDTKYLEIYQYFKMYDEYERLKWKGLVRPDRKYIDNKILHDQTAIYKFIVAEDGMTLIYWARIVGVFPTSVPRENFSKIEGELTYSINWHGQFVRDMDPNILYQFNRVTEYYRKSKCKNELPLWDTENHRFYSNWALCPYIYSAGNNNDDPTSKLKKMSKYYLRWMI